MVRDKESVLTEYDTPLAGNGNLFDATYCHHVPRGEKSDTSDSDTASYSWRTESSATLLRKPLNPATYQTVKFHEFLRRTWCCTKVGAFLNCLLFCLGVKLVRWHWGRKAGWGCLRIGCWGEYLSLRGTRWQGSGCCIMRSWMICTHPVLSGR